MFSTWHTAAIRLKTIEKARHSFAASRRSHRYRTYSNWQASWLISTALSQRCNTHFAILIPCTYMYPSLIILAPNLFQINHCQTKACLTCLTNLVRKHRCWRSALALSWLRHTIPSGTVDTGAKPCQHVLENIDVLAWDNYLGRNRIDVCSVAQSLGISAVVSEDQHAGSGASSAAFCCLGLCTAQQSWLRNC